MTRVKGKYGAHMSDRKGGFCRNIFISASTRQNLLQDLCNQQRLRLADKAVHPPSMGRVLVYIALDSPEAVECTCDQRRL